MRKVGVAVLGCGRIAQLVHLNVLRRLPGVELVGLAEVDRHRRDAAQRGLARVAAVSDYRELLGRSEVEAVVVGLATAFHAEAAVAALEQGKHLYLEKPIATNLADAQAVLSAWRHAGTTAMIGFNLRFHPLYQAARQELQSKTLGAVVA